MKANRSSVKEILINYDFIMSILLCPSDKYSQARLLARFP
jgi:hypothetical protein